jgi:hypothetical protein
MTEIEVFRMARQSGIDSVQQYDSDTSPIELLNRFAKLVAQRTWVGLTGEDIAEIYNQKDWDIHTNWDYERAIEAKLKEKNT